MESRYIFTAYIDDDLADGYIENVVEDLRIKSLELPDSSVIVFDNTMSVMSGLENKNIKLVTVFYTNEHSLLKEAIKEFVNSLRTSYSQDKVIILDKGTTIKDLMEIVKKVYNIIEHKVDIKSYVIDMSASMNLTETEVESIYSYLNDESEYDTLEFKNNNIEQIEAQNELTALSSEQNLEVIKNSLNDNQNLTSTDSHTILHTVFIKKLAEKLGVDNESTIEYIEKAVDDFLSKDISIEKETTIIEEKDIKEQVISDEEDMKVTDDEIIESISLEAVQKDNKMVSERALTLVKLFNEKYIDGILPHLIHKLENLVFFKENIDKFKINKGDKPEDIVSKVSGGVVHVELLKKNLSKWENKNENWKSETEKIIKRSQRQWRKEFVKFKKALFESTIPLIKNLLTFGESAAVIDDEDSIDLVVYNNTDTETKQEVKEQHSVESLKENTNIYNEKINLITLNDLIDKSEKEGIDLYSLVLSTESLKDRDELIEKGITHNLITGEKLSMTESIKMKIKRKNLLG